MPLQTREGKRKSVDVLVLAGAIGAEAPWAGGIPRPLLPLPGSTIIETLLQRVHEAFDANCVICSNGRTELLTSILLEGAAGSDGKGLSLEFDHVPRGTAGCLKACEPRLRGDCVLVTGSSVWIDDDLAWMLEQHRIEGNALTVFCGPPAEGNGAGSAIRRTPVGLYCCSREVLRFIPARGYFDLKEQLVPALQKAGLRVGAVALPGRTCEVSNWSGYLRVLSYVLSAGGLDKNGYKQLAPDVWCGSGVNVSPRARVVGPALLDHGCTLEDGATVIGPAIVGHGCMLGRGSWIIRAVAPPATFLAPGESVTSTVVAALGRRELLPEPADAAAESCVAGESRDAARAPDTAPPVPREGRLLLGGLAMLAVFGWAFSDVLSRLWQVWQNNLDYSVGQLVPLAALYMLWGHRRAITGMSLTPSPAGALVFAVGLAACAFGGYFLFSSAENFGMVLCANGVIVGMVGWRNYARICGPLLFLFLMLPLPGRVHDQIMLPLQSFCAHVSAGVLETIGVPVVRYGHVLEVSGQQTAVAEACNGLRMAVAFLIVTSMVAYLVKRPTWQKVVIVISSLPIAIGCNVLRIVTMAYSIGAGYTWVADGPLHTGLGLLMMPLALSIILLELFLLSNLAVYPARIQGRETEPSASVA